MAYERQYQNGVSWENEPSVNTPLNATNLNTMDEAIQNIDEETYEAFEDVSDRLSILQLEINAKQDELIFDEWPRMNSANPVTSRGIYRAIQSSVVEGIVPNDSSTAEEYLNTLKIGLTSYSTSAVKVESVTSISNSTISVTSANTINISDIISYPFFLHYSGNDATTGSGWTISLTLGQQTYSIPVYESDGNTVYSNNITKNSILLIKVEQTGTGSQATWKAIVLSASGGSGNGSRFFSDYITERDSSYNILHTSTDIYSGDEPRIGDMLFLYASVDVSWIVGSLAITWALAYGGTHNGGSINDFRDASQAGDPFTSDIAQGSLLILTRNTSGSNAWDLRAIIESRSATANAMSKTRYTINYSDWSSTTTYGNYYSYTLTLTTPLSTSYPPNIYISGADDSSFPTTLQRSNFNCLDECNITSPTSITLYALTKPNSSFYIYVEGEKA